MKILLSLSSLTLAALTATAAADPQEPDHHGFTYGIAVGPALVINGKSPLEAGANVFLGMWATSHTAFGLDGYATQSAFLAGIGFQHFVGAGIWVRGAIGGADLSPKDDANPIEGFGAHACGGYNFYHFRGNSTFYISADAALATSGSQTLGSLGLAIGYQFL